MKEQRSHIYGVIGEFETPQQIISAAEKAHQAGYRDVDAYTPFPIEGLAEALGSKSTLVPLICLTGALCGGLGGFFFQYWVNVSSYQQNIGGRPFNSWPAFIPVTFEMTILFASLFAVFGMLALNRLPQPHHPLFNAKRFSHASNDRFFLCIEAKDPKFSVSDATRFLQEISAQNVTEVEDD